MSKKHNTLKPTPSGGIRHRQHKARKSNQNWLWFILGVVIIAAAAYLLLSSKNTLPAEISVSQAYQKYQQGAFFLDVRSQAEWDQVHIPNSTLIPLDVLQNRSNELPRDRDIVVVCKSVVRSKEGMTILLQAGFSRASCMTDGLTAWKTAGYPLEGSNP